MFIDTHSHIYLDVFKEDIDNVILEAKNKGVDKIILPNVDSTTYKAMKQLYKSNVDSLIMMPGLHPCSVKDNYKEELKLVESCLNEPTKAIGEIGLDLYWDKTFYKEQKICYEIQIDWASERKIPFVIHSRDSLDETIDIVAKKQNGNLSGIFHCFNGSLEQAKKIIDIGFLMGIGGVVTFKNAGVDKVVQDIPLEYLVLETDAPYLTPAPYRGKRNEPAYIPIIAQKIADLHKTNIENVANITTKNALKLFDI